MDSPVPLERGQSESVGGNKPPPLPLPSKSQDPVGFDRMLSETPQEDSANKEEKADAKSGEPVRVRRKSVPNAGGRPRSLYERIVGKGTVFGSSGGKPMKRQSVGSAIANWFSKESPEERAVRSMLKNYRANLLAEQQVVLKAVAKHRRRLADQLAEFDKQEKQLYAWGLKCTLSKFRIQGWCRYARAKLQEQLSVEIDSLISERQKKIAVYLQLFEESSNRKEKFSLKSIEEFCKAPDALVLQDFTTLCLLEQFQRIEITCGIAARHFALLENKFSFRSHDQRKDMLYSILKRFSELPDAADLDNIETDLSWDDFSQWMNNRMEAQRALENEFSDFIEDQREKEGRLFYRWKSAITASLSENRDSQSQASADLTDAMDASMQETAGMSRKSSVLRVTAGSIKAFIRYFATDIVGVVYTIPRNYIQANIALTELLFFRRISSVVFQYPSRFLREQDDYWRTQSQMCRFFDPEAYHVPANYYLGKQHVRKRSSVEVPEEEAEADLRDDEEDAPCTPELQRNSLFTDDAIVRQSYHKLLHQFDSLQKTSNILSPASETSETVHLEDYMSSYTPEVASMQMGPIPEEMPNGVIDFSEEDIPAAADSSSSGNKPVPAHVETIHSPDRPTTTLHNILAPHPNSASCTCSTCMSINYLSRIRSLERDGHGGIHSTSHLDEHKQIVPGRYGEAYKRSSRVLSWMANTVVPREMIMYLSLACKWILRDAIDISGSRSIIGADVMVPLFTLALIYAQIPHMHMLLYVLMHFGDYEEQGDVSYNIASLEGSIMCIMGFTLPTEAEEQYQAYLQLKGYSSPGHGVSVHSVATSPPSDGISIGSPGFGPVAIHSKPPSQSKGFIFGNPSMEDVKEDTLAMEELGEWLRDQQTMEDTIEILQKDGWML